VLVVLPPGFSRFFGEQSLRNYWDFRPLRVFIDPGRGAAFLVTFFLIGRVLLATPDGSFLLGFIFFSFFSLTLRSSPPLVFFLGKISISHPIPLLTFLFLLMSSPDAQVSPGGTPTGGGFLPASVIRGSLWNSCPPLGFFPSVMSLSAMVFFWPSRRLIPMSPCQRFFFFPSQGSSVRSPRSPLSPSESFPLLTSFFPFSCVSSNRRDLLSRSLDVPCKANATQLMRGFFSL